MYSRPTRSTLAVLTMASAASMAPTRPLVSIMPNASLDIGISFWRGIGVYHVDVRAPIRYCSRVCPTSVTLSSALRRFSDAVRSCPEEDPRRGRRVPGPHPCLQRLPPPQDGGGQCNRP